MNQSVWGVGGLYKISNYGRKTFENKKTMSPEIGNECDNIVIVLEIRGITNGIDPHRVG